MRTFKITLSYDGTDFAGFQRQANARSVQAELEDALAPSKAQRDCRGSRPHRFGRARARAGRELQAGEPHRRRRSSPGAQRQLPEDVRVLAAEEAASGFHARFSARSKVYRYRISNTRVISPFQRRFAWHISRTLDLDGDDARPRASCWASTISRAFRRRAHRQDQATRDARTSMRTYRSEWTEEPLAGGGRLLTYEIARHRVPQIHGPQHRRHPGRGRRRPPDARRRFGICSVSGNRAAAGPTAPPSGLYLVRVDYDAAGPVSFSMNMSLDQLLEKIPRGSPDESLAREVNFDALPSHIAIIMDGNGRWAAQRHLPRVEGHRAGIESVRDVGRDVGAPRHRRADAVCVFGRELEAAGHRGDRADDAAEALSAPRARRDQPQQHPLPASLAAPTSCRATCCRSSRRARKRRRATPACSSTSR